MTTPNDIIAASLKKAGILGVGQTAQAEDLNDAFADLNDMLAQWQRKRWLIWHLVDNSFISTGSQSYTVGTGGNFNIVRPDLIEAAYFRQVNVGPNYVDYPLQEIPSREDYALVQLKNLHSFPFYYFYDSAYPLGYLYVYPIPQSGIYEIHIVTKDQLGQFSTINQSINLPLEYNAALKWNLAARLRVSYRLPVDEGLVALAKDALNVITMANVQMPLLKMPKELITNGGKNNYYNFYTQ